MPLWPPKRSLEVTLDIGLLASSSTSNSRKDFVVIITEHFKAMFFVNNERSNICNNIADNAIADNADNSKITWCCPTTIQQQQQWINNESQQRATNWTQNWQPMCSWNIEEIIENPSASTKLIQKRAPMTSGTQRGPQWHQEPFYTLALTMASASENLSRNNRHKNIKNMQWPHHSKVLSNWNTLKRPQVATLFLGIAFCKMNLWLHD